MLSKNKYNRIFYIFLISHLLVWSLVPALSNINLPLDTIEALAWGSNLSWGYGKHPPLSALAVEIIFNIFGNRDWAYYLLSQIFVCIAFLFVWKFSYLFFKDSFLSLCSVLLLEGIYFYNFTTPEFNVNICQLPFWALTVFYSWKAFNSRNIQDFILTGIFMGLGFLSKYLFIYLIIAIKIIFLFELYKKRKINLKYFLPGIIFMIILSPHIIWLINNDFATLSYALKRTGIETSSYLNHFFNPIIFMIKQIGILLPAIIMFLFLLKKVKIKLSFKNNKNFFILAINIIPIILIFLTSVLTGAKIRTMWMTPFYLFFGTLIIHFFKEYISKVRFKKFITIFLVLFILSPISYIYISLTNEFKRTDYPGKEISDLVQKRWDRNFSNNISIVVGDEWFAGNLSYHLQSRPKWYNTIENDLSKINSSTGVIYAGNPKILEKFCPGVYGTIKPIGICMIGSR
jgi:4-amino-4-deoxy-L-arabinose transferase-like glycosyltransferase